MRDDHVCATFCIFCAIHGTGQLKQIMLYMKIATLDHIFILSLTSVGMHRYVEVGITFVSLCVSVCLFNSAKFNTVLFSFFTWLSLFQVLQNCIDIWKCSYI